MGTKTGGTYSDQGTWEGFERKILDYGMQPAPARVMSGHFPMEVWPGTQPSEREGREAVKLIGSLPAPQTLEQLFTTCHYPLQ
jgi:hypothetical protein